MPPEGLEWLPGPELLTDDEVVRLVSVAVGLGVTEVRFTGGEPLLRRGLVSLVERVGALTPRPRMSVTTNGIGLERVAPALAAAGLDRVNVSLDTLDRERFVTIARRDRLADVLGGLAAAADAGPDTGEDQHRADARGQRRRGGRRCCAGRSARATTCVSSSRCRWTPSTAGTAPPW